MVDNQQVFSSYLKGWAQNDKAIWGYSMLLCFAMLPFVIFGVPWLISYTGTKILHNLGYNIVINYIEAFGIVCCFKIATPVDINAVMLSGYGYSDKTLTEDGFKTIIMNMFEHFKHRIELMIIVFIFAYFCL